MSSQVDEFFERHRRRAVGDDDPAIATIAPAAVVRGDIAGDFEVEPGAVLRVDGEVDGDVCVRARAIVEVRGEISGSAEIESAGQLRVEGGIGGDLTIAPGGIVSIAGDIGGDATIEGALLLQSGEIAGRTTVRSTGEFIND